MAVEGARRREFAELVADHVLRAVDRNELAAVMNREGESDHVGHDHRAARPGPDDPLVGRTRGCGYLLQQMSVDKRTFFRRSWHLRVLSVSSFARLAPFAARPAAHDVTIRQLLAAGLVALGRRSPRRLRMISLGAALA